MNNKEKPPVIEGKIVNKSKQPEQFISEQGIILGVVALVLIVAGYFGYPYVRDWLTTPPKPEQVEASGPTLENRLAALEGQVTNLEAIPAQDNPAAGLEDRIAALETAVTNLPATNLQDDGTATLVEDPRIAEMAVEIAALKTILENLAASQGTYSPGFSSALAELAPPLYKPRPFAGELEQVRIYILEMPALDQIALSASVGILDQFAGTGIVSMDQLEADFFNATLEALRTEGLDPNAGWWARTWAKIKGQVVIRRTDGSAGSDLEAAITNAEDFLAIGEAGSALEVILALPEDQKGAFQDWINLAGQRVAALQAFEVLTGHLSRSANGQQGN